MQVISHSQLEMCSFKYFLVIAETFCRVKRNILYMTTLSYRYKGDELYDEIMKNIQYMN